MPRGTLNDLVESLRNKSQRVLFAGVPGTGKTTLAGSLALRHLARRPPRPGYLLTCDPVRQLDALQAVGARRVDLADVDQDGAPLWADRPSRHWRDRHLVIIDEAHRWTTNPERAALTLLIRESRPRGCHLFLTSQRPAALASVSVDLVELLDWVVCGCMPGDRNLDYLRLAVGADVAEAASLDRFRYLVWRVTPF